MSAYLDTSSKGASRRYKTHNIWRMSVIVKYEKDGEIVREHVRKRSKDRDFLLDLEAKLRSGIIKPTDLENPPFNKPASGRTAECAIRGIEYPVEQLHAHHIIPRGKPHFGSNSAENIVLVHEDIHKLIHAASVELVKAMLKIIEPTPAQLADINGYRVKAGNLELAA